MKLYIPEIGDVLKLTSDWNFNLYYEYRNESLLNKLHNTKFEWFNYNTNKIEYLASVLEKDTELKVDRIYIRKGNSEYSSLTFRILNGNYKGCRFWAKLGDVNNIEFNSMLLVKPKLNVKVSIYSPVNVNLVGRVIYDVEKDHYLNKELLCYINNDISNIKLFVDCKLSKLDSILHKYKIEEFNIIAVDGDNLIGCASTTTALIKIIKDYISIIYKDTIDPLFE